MRIRPSTCYIVATLTVAGHDDFATGGTFDLVLLPQSRGRSHRAIAAARALDLDFCVILQRVFGQSAVPLLHCPMIRSCGSAGALTRPQYRRIV